MALGKLGNGAGPSFWALAALSLWPSGLAAGPGTADDQPEWALARDGHPLAGYEDGHFYLRDATDNFRLFPGGLLMLDAQAWAGEGVDDLADLSARLLPRRARLALTGQVLEPITWHVSLAADGLPVSRGRQQIQAAPPGAAPTANSARWQEPQPPAGEAGLWDAWIDAELAEWIHLRVGQFRAPFTLENGILAFDLPFHERALAVRALGIPNGAEAGAAAWGEVDVAGLSYSVGLFEGDGRNRHGVDSRGDVMARIAWRPLAHSDGPLRGAQIGASLRSGWREGDRVDYDYPEMTTQQGWSFWAPVYVDSLGRATHVVPADRQTGVGAELRVPWSRLELRAEAVWIANQTREAVEGFQSSSTERTGRLRGSAGYLALGWTVAGSPPEPGDPSGAPEPPVLDFVHRDPLLPEQKLELWLRLEMLQARYESARRAGAADSAALDGDVRVRALGLAAVHSATRHVRTSLDWTVYSMPDSGTQQNRALTPAAALGRDAATFHELGVRFAAGF